MNSFKTMDDLNVAGKKVLLRTDLNVPMQNGNITDTTRIERTLPTVRELANGGATVVILSHFGRPKGQVVPDMSLGPIAAALGEAMGVEITFCDTTVGPEAEAAVAGAGVGTVVVMENLRFNEGEEKNDIGFAVQLAALGDIYVNDAFSAAHRAHASTEAITTLLPAIAGRLMQEELEALEGALEAPEHPVAAIVGGAKVSTKMDVLNHLMDKVDYLIIGGGMANTFLYADGVEIGASLCEKDMADDARAIRDAAKVKGCEIIIPTDAVVAWKFEADTPSETVALDAVPADAMILDAGPASVAAINARLASCRTLVWNGPMGAFEINPFDMATNAIAQEAARLTQAGGLLSVAGGGDTVSALVGAGVVDQFSYVSTAGGAFLEWLEGKELPGVAALKAHG
jgi:phosphoglycerate kinase